MVSIPILEHIELSLATAPLAPPESEFLKRTPWPVIGEAEVRERWQRRVSQHGSDNGGPT
jgi:hypothetical protein